MFQISAERQRLPWPEETCRKVTKSSDILHEYIGETDVSSVEEMIMDAFAMDKKQTLVL